MALFSLYLLSLSIGCRTPPCAPVEEIPYDGVDQDCDGFDLTDVDCDGFDLGEDCDDEDAASFPGATEVPYDSVDQDCDGADLCDVDDDGFDAEVCGGTDCYDDDVASFPGATEVPWDGVDQDCDGADLCDVDGDGFDALTCGGTDCHDEDSMVFPGAEEILADAVDQDCDGRLDEVEACPDSSGQYLTIQEAVDAAPDDGIVEICPGTWTEPVVIVDRILSLEGAGEMPEDTDLTTMSEDRWCRTVDVTGGSVMLRNMKLTAPGCSWGPSVYGDSSSELNLYRVWLSSNSESASNSSSLYSQGVVHVRASRVDGERTVYVGSGASSFIEVTGSVIAGGATVGGDAVTLRNVLLLDGCLGSSYYWPEWTIENATFIDTDVVIYLEYWIWREAPIGSLVLRSSILAADSITISLSTRYNMSYYGCCEPEDPDRWWDIDTAALLAAEHAQVMATSTCFGALPDYDECDPGSTTSDSFEGDLFESIIFDDPMFQVSGDAGSYSLSADSPAVDAGVGEPDPDGSPNDLGAFGGPDAKWHEEYPWPLD